MSGLLLTLFRLFSPAVGVIAVDTISLVDEVLQVVAHTFTAASACPSCGTASQRVHSRYTRTLADLPCCGHPISLTLAVRRFFCDEPACARRTFAERLPETAPPYARRTARLQTALVPLAFTLGGNPGVPLTRTLRLGITGVSRHTLLRVIRRTPCGVPTDATDRAVQVVGVDDWAWKRGRRYGTIICDLQRRRPLDLLPERETTATATWLAAHPSITVVSRDRGGTSADAAAQGAPTAVQVADRWHLLKNLGDAVELFLRREHVQLPAPASAHGGAEATVDATVDATPAAVTQLPQEAAQAALVGEEDRSAGLLPHPLAEEGSTQHYPISPREARFAQVHARHQAGLSIHAIATEVGLTRNTVRRYLRSAQVPDWGQGRTRRGRRLDPYRAYLLERWNAGCHNGRQLYRDIRAQGYRGGVSQVGVFIARLREQLPNLAAPRADAHGVSSQTLRWLLVRRPDQLDEEEAALVQALLKTHATVATLYEVVQQFGHMVRTRHADGPDVWLLSAARCGITEIQSFVQGVRRDHAAVTAGLTLEWSQGQVEGQITRLKLLKRQMYGRANFDLLRQRVLYRSA